MRILESEAMNLDILLVKSVEYLLGLAQAGQAMDSLQNHP